MPGPFASVYINLVCGSVANSEVFFAKLGWTRNGAMSEPENNVVCIDVSPEVCLMLVPKEAWASYLPEGRSVADPATSTQTVIVLPALSGEEAQAFLDKVSAAGGKVDAARQMDSDGNTRHMRTWSDTDGNFFGVGWKDAPVA